MRVLMDSICRFCKDVFCCAECRYKHEIKYHAIAIEKPIEVEEQNKSGTSKNGECEEIYLFCPICEKQPLVLKQHLHKEILQHIELFHLPLRCQKCFKTYAKMNDFKEFSKCLSQSHESFTDEASKVTVTKAALPHCVVSQSSPSSRQALNESHITPISVINMRWKARSKLHREEFISDSVSSIKNISSISNNSSSRQGIEIAPAAKGKVIRCSSTPVQVDMVFAKPKEQTFNGNGSHMSSIQYNSGFDSDTSPAYSYPNSQALDPINRYIRVAGSRPRMTAVTPLRQVMSKSIQKAFAEHGIPQSNTGKISYTYQRKNMFDSNSSPEIDDQRSPPYTALDLRLSPAVRRSQFGIVQTESIQKCNKKDSNELPYLRRGILLSAQKLTTESIVITRTEQLSSVSSSTSAVSSNFSMNSVKPYPQSTVSHYESAGCNSTGNSVFKSCSSVEIITATTAEVRSFDEENVAKATIQPNTPTARINGLSINKKIIKFETPKIKLSNIQHSPSSPIDEFFTPNSTPQYYENGTESDEIRQRKLLVKHNLSGTFSTLQSESVKKCADSTTTNPTKNFSNESYIESDDVFVSLRPETSSQEENFDNNRNNSQKLGGLWSIVASVMRLPSLKGKTSREKLKSETCSSTSSSSNSLVKRCASIAGTLVRSNPLVDENELCSLKRKRTYTTDNKSASLYLEDLNSTEATSSLNTSSKRIRIQGRRPIDRMRLNS